MWESPAMAAYGFIRARLDQMIDLDHPLAVQAPRKLLAQIGASAAQVFAHCDRMGRGLLASTAPRARGWMTGSFAAWNRGWRKSATSGKPRLKLGD